MEPALLAELFGILAMAVSFLIYLSNRRKQIIVLKGVSDVLWAANNFTRGAVSGGGLSVLAIFRSIVFYYRTDRKWAQSPLWKYAFCVLCFASPILEVINKQSFQLLPFVPAIGSVLCVYGFYAKEPSRIRLLNFIGQIPWLTYYLLSRNVSGTISCLIVVTSIVLGFAKELINKKKDA